MTETRIHIPVQDITLEALLDDLPGERGVVVTHPHPLYGGEMHNNVVTAIVRAYRKEKFTTLRFNFRGVGKSSGSYGGGVGEQEDVLAALNCLRDLGKRNIDLAGYSFGAWVNAANLCRFYGEERLIMISPPVSFFDFSFLKDNSRLRLVIAGSRDEIGPAQMIEEMLPLWNPTARYEVIEGADHFYWGKEEALVSVLRCFLEEEASAE